MTAPRRKTIVTKTANPLSVPSNRRSKRHKRPDRMGVDRLSLCVQVRRSLDQRRQHVSLGGMRLTIEALKDFGSGPGVRLDFNPSRMIAGHQAHPWSIDAVRYAAQVVWDEVRSKIHPICNLDDARVTRVDVAIDFKVRNARLYIVGLLPLHRKWARRHELRLDARTGAPQTLYVGSEEGLVRLYDRGALDADVAPNTLRFEMQARSGWLRRYGSIDRVSSLDAEALETLVANRWQWFRGDVAFLPSRAMRAELERRYEGARLEQYLRFARVATRFGHRNREQACEALAKLGMLPVPARVKGPAVRLDYSRGKEVVSNA